MDVDFVIKSKRGAGNVEIINQFHPLIRFISSELKTLTDEVYPLVAVSVNSVKIPQLSIGHYAFASRIWSFNGLKTIEKIQVRAVKLNDNFDLLSSEESWYLVNNAKRHGSDWLAVKRYLASDTVGTAFDQCDELLQRDYDLERQNQADENHDRISFQIQTATRHRDRQLERLVELASRYEKEANRGLLQMTIGRIDKIRRSFEIQLARFSDGAEMSSRTDSICYGVVELY